MKRKKCSLNLCVSLFVCECFKSKFKQKFNENLFEEKKKQKKKSFSLLLHKNKENLKSDKNMTNITSS